MIKCTHNCGVDHTTEWQNHHTQPNWHSQNWNLVLKIQPKHAFLIYTDISIYKNILTSILYQWVKRENSTKVLMTKTIRFYNICFKRAENVYYNIKLNGLWTRTVHWMVRGALFDTTGELRLITYKKTWQVTY